MSILFNAFIIIATLIMAPVVGGLLSGLDRKITARMQNRVGPPVLQPFYDFFKLLGKEKITVNQTQMAYVLGYLLFAVLALVMLIFKQDMLLLVFAITFSNLSLIIGAMSDRSPYSKIGAQRESMQMLSYVPVLVFMAVGIFLETKSFMIESIFSYGKPMILILPLVFLAFIYVLAIKLRKSPFDFSTSHHGHQELVKGLTTEFSGLQLALIELTDWYERVLLLGLIVLFYAKPLWIGILIALISYFIVILIDNISTRLTWRWMLKATWVVGAGAVITNIIWLYNRQ